MADGSILIDTKIDESGIKEGLSSLTSKVKAGALVISAALAAGTAAVVKFGSEFESSMAKSSTLFGDVDVNMNQLNTDMLKLSDTTGVAASQLGNTLYNALSAGIPATDNMAESLGFLEKNAKLAKAGFTDVDTATTATAKVLNAYKMDVSETDKVHKILMQTQNKGITTVGELGSVLAQVTPTAAAMNVKFEQVGAALANMTAQGTPTAQATTQLNQLFAELGKKGTQAQKGLTEATKGTQYAGMSFQDLMAKGVPLNEILDLMDTYAKKNKKSMIDMFGSLEAGKAALANAGQNSAAFTQNLKAMSTETDVVGEAYDKVMDTFEEQSKKALNSLKNLGIGIYNNIKEPLKDSVKNASKGLDELSRSFNSGKLKRSVSDLGNQIGKTASSLLDFAIKAIPKVIDGLSWLMKNGKTIINVIIALKTAQVAYNAAMVAAKVIGSVTQLIQFGAGVMKSLTTATSLATVATTAFNGTMTATQGIVALATGGITILLGALAMWGVNAMMSKDANDELSDSIKEQKKALEELDKATREQAETAAIEFDTTKKYHDELKGMIDSEGNIIGNKERVKYLIEQINKLMPDAITLTEEQKVQYNESAEALDKLIKKKRAEAVLEAYREEANTARKQEKELLDKLVEANKAVEEQTKKTKEAYDAWNDNTSREAVQGRLHRYENEKETLEKLEQAQNSATENYRINNEKKERFLKAEEKFSEGHYDKMNEIIRMQPENIQWSNDMTMEKYNAHLEDLTRYHLELKTAHENNNSEITAEMVREAEAQVNNWRQHGEQLLSTQQQTDTNLTTQMISEGQNRNAQVSQLHGEGALSSTLAWDTAYSGQKPTMEKNMLTTLMAVSTGATKNPDLANINSQGGIYGITNYSAGYTGQKDNLQSKMWNTLYNASIEAGASPSVAKANADSGVEAVKNISGGVAERENLIYDSLLSGMKNGSIKVKNDGTLYNIEKATGKDTVEGIGVGAQSKQSWLGSKLVGILNLALSVARRSQEINSPSKKWKRLMGVPMAEGVGVGFEEKMKDVSGVMKRTLNANVDNLAKNSAIKFKLNSLYGKNGNVINNNDNGVTQNVYLQTETNSPAEAARKLRHAAQMIAYQK